MQKKTTPAPRRAGTRRARALYTRRERARREALVVQQLEELSTTNPARFEEMLKLLARLVVEVERDRE